MSLIKCKECENMVSSRAKTCPRCGAKLKKSIWRIPLIIILSIVGGLFLLQPFITKTREEVSRTLEETKGILESTATNVKKDIAEQVKKWINTETKIPKELRITCKSVLLIKESRSKYTGVAEFSKGGNVGVTVDVDKDGTMIFRLDQTDLIALYANTKLEFADIADYKLTSKYISLGNGQQSENTSGFTIGDWVNQLKNRKACIIKVKIDSASMLTINVAIPLSTTTIYCSIDHDTKTCITEGCEDGSGQGSTDSEETFQVMNQLYQLIQLKNDEDAKAYFERGVESFREGRFQEGIELVKEAIRIKPDLAEAHCSLGNAYLVLDRYEEAIESCKQAIRIKPDYAEAYGYWGSALGWMAQKKDGEVRQQLLAEEREKCLKAESIKTGTGAYNLACVCALLDDKIECQKWLKVGEKAGTLPTQKYATSDTDLESVRNEDWFKQIRWSDDPK